MWSGFSYIGILDVTIALVEDIVIPSTALHILIKVSVLHCVILKGTVHPIFLILSIFTHPLLVSNLFDFISSLVHKRRYFEESQKKKKKNLI